MISIFKKAVSIAKHIIHTKRRLAKYNDYNIASNGEDMYEYANMIKEFHNIQVENIFEIGANFGQDAEVLAECFSVPHCKVYLFEAHPQIAEVDKKLHPEMNVYNYAVSNTNGKIKLNAVDINDRNSGISSIRNNPKHMYEKKYEVDCIRMFDFMKNNGIQTVSFLKLDVEGCTWEVLQGFGNRIKDIGCIQLEAEHTESWQGEVLFEQIADYLKQEGFELKIFKRYRSQSDSLWMKKELFEKE